MTTMDLLLSGLLGFCLLVLIIAWIRIRRSVYCPLCRTEYCGLFAIKDRALSRERYKTRKMIYRLYKDLTEAKLELKREQLRSKRLIHLLTQGKEGEVSYSERKDLIDRERRRRIP